MDRIHEYLKKPWMIPALCAIAGVLFGWIVLGWGVFPVQWKDASPESLRQDLKADYLRMAVDSFGVNGDTMLAQQRWKNLGKGASGVLATVAANPRSTKADAITGFSQAVNAQAGAAVSQPSGSTTSVAPAADTTTTAPAATPKKKSGFLSVAVGVFIVLTIVLIFAIAYILIKKGGKLPSFSNRNKVEAIPDQIPAVEVASDKGPEFFRPANEAPVSQFMTTYMQGEDQYDDSFSIDNPVGEFLGECGVGITESIGVGDPKKAAAFEVWLFDKNDIQTVTKVLMSDHVFKDPSMHQKLLSKGEPILAEPGKRILLETATLQLEARIVDMNYGQGPLPPNSYFERLTFELAVWPKRK
jgi:hypothetical protein